MKICWLENFQREANNKLKITTQCLISIFTFCKVIYISRIKIARTYLILLRRESEWELRENSQCQHSNLQNKLMCTGINYTVWTFQFSIIRHCTAIVIKLVLRITRRGLKQIKTATPMHTLPMDGPPNITRLFHLKRYKNKPQTDKDKPWNMEKTDSFLAGSRLVAESLPMWPQCCPLVRPV